MAPVPTMKKGNARRLQNIIQSNLFKVIQMVMIDLHTLTDKYSNVIGHASDHCGCDECTKEFYDTVQPLVYDHWDVEEDDSPEEYLAESIDEATMEVIDNLAFLGDGTTSKDVMISILALEATIAQIKIFLLESE
jgi:hypothetical protein